MRLNKEYISNTFLPLLWHCKVLLSVTTTNYGIEEQSKQNVGPLTYIYIIQGLISFILCFRCAISLTNLQLIK